MLNWNTWNCMLIIWVKNCYSKIMLLLLIIWKHVIISVVFSADLKTDRLTDCIPCRGVIQPQNMHDNKLYPVV